jgi:hypothetical protein
VFIVPPTDPRVSDSTTNVLVWDGPTVPARALIKQHKTSHLRGMLVRPLPPSLQAVVAASLEMQPRDTLFASPRDNTPFSSEAVHTNWANRELALIFGRPCTCNIARHAFCSALDTSKLSTRQLESIAALMGHSLQQQRAYVRLDTPSAATASIVAASGEYDLPVLASGSSTAAGASHSAAGSGAIAHTQTTCSGGAVPAARL